MQDDQMQLFNFRFYVATSSHTNVLYTAIYWKKYINAKWT